MSSASERRRARRRQKRNAATSKVEWTPPPHDHTAGGHAQLISYIAHAAPATRRPATGDEPFMRAEIGFTPRWYSTALSETSFGPVDFGERWHLDPAYRADTIQAMARETTRRFGKEAQIGVLQDPDNPTDLITGTFGALIVPGIYGIPIWWQEGDWLWAEHGQHLTDEMMDTLEPPDLDNNPFWNAFLEQLDWIAKQTGRLDGFMNWQSVINTGYRMRGEPIFTDMVTDPGRVKHLFDCIVETMIEGARRLYARQAETGVKLTHFTVSNCLVNMLSPQHYAEFILPYDKRIADEFSVIGIHNCAWNANPYLEHYASVPKVAYVDMGIESDMVTACKAFPHTRRALMYTPMDIKEKSSTDLAADLDRIAREYGACDLVCADIDLGVSDSRILGIIDRCRDISEKYGGSNAVSSK
ncbi:hypothetical protein KFU94_56835 [Chloroflexi bacterium TSY]|nr:hypothetical protein [Chloroflexi bacterium TSY]